MHVVRITRFGIRSRSLVSSSIVSARFTRRCIRLQHAVVDVLQRHVDVRHDPLRRGDGVDQFVGHVHRVEVHEPNPIEAFDLFQLAKQLGQPRLAVEVHAVVGRVLGDDHQLAHAIGRQFAGFGDDFFHRLRVVLAAHFGNRAERAEPVAAFRDFQKRKVPRRDSQPGRIGQRMRRRGMEDHPLFVKSAEQTVGNLGDFLAAEHADQVIDLRARFEQRSSFCRSARQPETITPRSLPRRFRSSISSIAANDSVRAASMNPHVLTTAKSAPCGSFDQLVAIELQQAEHPLAVDEVLWGSRG